MKAIVTGCAGLIGSHLADRLLAEGYKVTGIDCFSDYYARSVKESNIRGALQNEKFTFMENDLLEIDSFPDADYVFHEAAQAGVRTARKKPGWNPKIFVREGIGSSFGWYEREYAAGCRDL